MNKFIRAEKIAKAIDRPQGLPNNLTEALKKFCDEPTDINEEIVVNLLKNAIIENARLWSTAKRKACLAKVAAFSGDTIIHENPDIYETELGVATATYERYLKAMKECTLEDDND